LVARLPQVRTAQGGRQVFYRCPADANGHVRLTEKAERDRHSDEELARAVVVARGEGAFTVVPDLPRACYDAEGICEHIGRPPLTAIPEITPAQRAVLWDTARYLSTWIDPGWIHTGLPAKEVSGSRAVDDFNAWTGWGEILEPHGWVSLRQQEGVTYWARPGGAPACSAATGYVTAHLFSCGPMRRA
jgi:hypothetical protein